MLQVFVFCKSFGFNF